MNGEGSTTTRETLIRLREVVVAPVGARTRVLIHDLDLTVETGDILVIAGASGSGKTTLLHVMAGLLRPAAGVVEVFGRDTSSLHGDQWIELRMKMGVVFEGGSRIFNQMTVAENVALPLRYHRNCGLERVTDEVEALLRWAGLEECADESPSLVGRALRLRTGLARAMALRPRILMLDSPLARLETSEQRWWLEVVERLAAGVPELGGDPVTLVVSTDHLGVWAPVATRFAVITGHAWVDLGTRETLERNVGAGYKDLVF